MDPFLRNRDIQHNQDVIAASTAIARIQGSPYASSRIRRRHAGAHDRDRIFERAFLRAVPNDVKRIV